MPNGEPQDDGKEPEPASVQPPITETALTTEQKHFRTLQNMLRSRRRLTSEERSALSFASTLVAARGFEEALPNDG